MASARPPARRDLTEQDPAFFKSDEEMREFAKRLRPEEANQLSVYAMQFHVKQKNLETLIEARKRARAEKSENKHRAYTKAVADGARAPAPRHARIAPRPAALAAGPRPARAPLTAPPLPGARACMRAIGRAQRHAP